MAEGNVGGRRCVLVLEVSDNTAAGFPREITMAVVLTEKNGGPVEGSKINFFFDGGTTTFKEADTNEHGRTVVIFTATKGGQKMTATVDGSGLSGTYAVPVEKAAAKITDVKDFNARTISVSEEFGLERISVCVNPPRVVRFEIEGNGVIYQGDTDINGFGLYPPISEPPLHHSKKVKYVVQLPGLMKQEELVLEAPPRHPLPPPPPDGLGFFRRWGWRLWYNNNWRLAFAWVVLIVWLCGNLLVFGVGIESDSGAEWVKYQGMSDAQKFFYESWHRRDGVPLPTEPGAIDQFSNWLGSWSWWLWFWWLLASIVYVPVAFWDELSRAWYKARKTVMERREGVSRGGETTGPAVPAGAEQAPMGGRDGGRRSFFTETVMETLHEIVAEVAVHGISRRFR